MAEEAKTNQSAATPTPEPKVKEWKYVGPGSDPQKKEQVPTIANLPVNPKLPALGTLKRAFPANELPAEYIPYVLRTNPATKGWWV